ncbi:cobyric acid synthase [Clostridia bacterium]|nr:cobyric acid synthase [Clostridia bacterium]
MAKSIMIQGTMSNTGKSVIAAGLCRIFMQDGYKTAPFKSQNMALNSYITADGGEMGRAQVMQAEAAGIAPDVRMNPILLKPTSDKGSQVILNGKVFGDYSATDYYLMRERLIPEIVKAYGDLSDEYEIIVLEGAGSPAEINLRGKSIPVNMEMAELAGAPVILAGDIDRGGVFASLAGTMMLFTEEERARVKGVVINKFRGDVEILKPGLPQLEELVKVPVLGVIPYLRLDLDDEDSLSTRFSSRRPGGLVDIAVIRLPRISNFTDFNPFEYIDGVDLRYVGGAEDLGEPDLLIIPGTKNTLADLVWLKESRFAPLILKHAAKGKPVFGICGGYQMLGERVSDPHGVEQGGELTGLGLLRSHTEFDLEKSTVQVTGRFGEVSGIFANLSGAEFYGYEIHMGKTESEETPLQTLSNSGDTATGGEQRGNIYGSYVHGIFDSADVSHGIVTALMKAKGIDASDVVAKDMRSYKETQYDALADALRASLDMERIYDILWKGL